MRNSLLIMFFLGSFLFAQTNNFTDQDQELLDTTKQIVSDKTSSTSYGDRVNTIIKENLKEKMINNELNDQNFNQIVNDAFEQAFKEDATSKILADSGLTDTQKDDLISGMNELEGLGNISEYFNNQTLSIGTGDESSTWTGESLSDSASDAGNSQSSTSSTFICVCASSLKNAFKDINDHLSDKIPPISSALEDLASAIEDNIDVIKTRRESIIKNNNVNKAKLLAAKEYLAVLKKELLILKREKGIQ